MPSRAPRSRRPAAGSARLSVLLAVLGLVAATVAVGPVGGLLSGDAGSGYPMAASSNAPRPASSGTEPAAGQRRGSGRESPTGAAITPAAGAGLAGRPAPVNQALNTTTTTSVHSVGTASQRSGAPGTETPTIGVSGGHLVLGGKSYVFVGVNAYEIGTSWGTNEGCGSMESDADLDQLFGSLAPNSLVRFWAFQGAIATNYTTHQIDWAPLDRVFAAAAAHGQRLIVTLTDQGGVCDGSHWQDVSWYDGGFQQVFNGPTDSDGKGLTPLSFWDYLHLVVNRYKSSPALGMWEPISEPEASTCPPQYGPTSCSGHQTCPDEARATAALRHFFDVVGGEIHALDPAHLVEDGVLGSGQCGASGQDFATVGASPGIDVLSYHDYYGASLIGGDQWNGEGVRLSQAASLGKPIIAGEMGIWAAASSNCTSLPTRADQLWAKIQAQMRGGASGVLVWNWAPSLSGPCDFATSPGDPLMQVVSAGPQ